MTLAVALILSATINITFLRWRFRLSDSIQAATFPEALIEESRSQSQTMRKIDAQLRHDRDNQSEYHQSTSQQFDGLADAFLGLRDAITQRDRDIRRLQQGYDASIFLRFVRRFVNVDIAMADELSEPSSTDQLEHLRPLLQDALEECGVETYSPSIGDNLRTATGIEDNPGVEAPPTPEQEFTIAQVVRHGYRIRTDKSEEIVVPARVIIYGSAEGTNHE